MGIYLLGVDGGGTKTLAQAIDPKGRPMFRIKSGALNPNSETKEQVQAVLCDILQHAAVQAGTDQLAAVCIGAAGVSNPHAKALLEQSLERAGFHGQKYITGDHVAALAGALGRPEGMLLISGTGSICAGRTAEGYEVRAGGMGHRIDDEGSGYAMGRDVLRAVVQAEDGRGPATCLTRAVFQELGIRNMEELLAFVYAPQSSKKDIAALARLLPDAAAQEDRAALAIYDHAVRELLRLVKAVSMRLPMLQGELALAGSVLLKDELLQKKLKVQLQLQLPGLTMIPARQDAAWGAARLAQSIWKVKAIG